MPITINGSGTVTGISAGGLPDASVNTEDLNAGTASAGQKLVASGASGAMSWGSSIVSGTAQNSTSGTAIDFTGIPSWVKRVTVMFSGVSTSGTSNPIVQLGASGGLTTSGYLGAVISSAVSPAAANMSSGFTFGTSGSSVATNLRHGIMTIANLSGNSWCCGGTVGYSDVAVVGLIGGAVSLSGTLTQIRITTTNGTDTFDAGSINIIYE